MTKQPDPVFAGLAEGLKPADVELPPDTTAAAKTDEPVTLDLATLIALGADHRFTEIADAVQTVAEAADRQLRETKNLTNAADRIADVLETLVGLFASVIGVANSKCGYGDTERIDVVNFVRTGLGRKDFRCDADSVENANDSD